MIIPMLLNASAYQLILERPLKGENPYLAATRPVGPPRPKSKKWRPSRHSHAHKR